jgi:hypothetical protein
LISSKVELPYDPVIPLLGIYLKKCALGYNRATCALMYIAALFTTAMLRNSLDAPQLMNGLKKKGGIYAQWSFIQP